MRVTPQKRISSLESTNWFRTLKNVTKLRYVQVTFALLITAIKHHSGKKILEGAFGNRAGKVAAASATPHPSLLLVQSQDSFSHISWDSPALAKAF